MNVKLRKTFEFSTGVVYNNEFSVNYYTAIVSMTTMSSDVEKHNIAYERMKYWLDWVLSNSIIMANSDPMCNKWLATEQRIVLLPDQPVDQLVGIMLYRKLTAIVEDQFLITDLELSSSLGDHMSYIHSHGESLGPMASDSWWNDSGPGWTATSKRKSRVMNIIEMSRETTWKDLDLDFDAVDLDTAKPVVFVDFSKNEKE